MSARKAGITAGDVRRWGHVSKTGGRSVPKDIDLPAGPNADILRAAAAEATSPRVQARLLAMSTLYETGSFRLTTAHHNICEVTLRHWLHVLANEGSDGFKRMRSAVTMPRLTSTEIEDIVAATPAKGDENLVRAVSAVLDGVSPEAAATQWMVTVKSIKHMVAQVRKNGAKAFELAWEEQTPPRPSPDTRSLEVSTSPELRGEGIRPGDAPLVARHDGGKRMRHGFDSKYFETLIRFSIKPKTIKKYKVLQLAYSGWSFTEIAADQKVSVALVESWTSRFNAGGLTALMEA